MDAGSCKEDGRAIVTGDGEFVVRICRRYTNDALVSGGKRCNVIGVISCRGNQNDAPRPRIVDRFLQGGAIPGIAECHENDGGTMVCRPEDSVDNVAVLP